MRNNSEIALAAKTDDNNWKLEVHMDQEHKLPPNRPWKAKSKFGRERVIQDVDVLLAAAHEYFEWCENNPLYTSKVIAYQGEAKMVNVPLPRVPTLWGLWRFIGITGQVWMDWRRNHQPEFYDAVMYIDDYIKENKFAGAAVEIYNAGFIARELGLVDRQDVTSSDGSMSPVTRVELVAPGAQEEDGHAED